MDLNYEQLEQEILDVLGIIALRYHIQIEGKAESKG
jgi:hypothetical protein